MNETNEQLFRVLEILPEHVRRGLARYLSEDGREAHKLDDEMPGEHGPADLSAFERLNVLERIFGLSALERDMLIFCFVQEIDPLMGGEYARVQKDPTSPFATARLFLTVLGDSIETRLNITRICSGAGPLFKYRLLRIEEPAEPPQGMPGSSPIALEPRILRFLCGSDDLDEATHRVLSVGESLRMEEIESVAHNEVPGTTLANIISAPLEGVLVLRGEAGTELTRIAAAISGERSEGCLRLRLARLRGFDERTAREILFRCVREALLWNFEIVLDELEPGEVISKTWFSYLLEVLEEMPVPLIVILPREERLELTPEQMLRHTEIEIPIPSTSSRERIWLRALEGLKLEEAALDAGDLARRFKFTAGRIRAAASFAQNQAILERGPGASLNKANILEGCRSQSNRRLGDVAGKVETKFGWGDIVLPEEHIGKLREACTQVQYMEEIFERWGFEKVIAAGRGLNMLFSGPSGTGKTMAATIMAAELGLEMYKVDLSTVISKYIGETEKNLSRIFAEAETAHAILFFDEADAIFGKRSEVQSAHDRFANIEVGYLLQRMEEYTGITILATNLSENIDDAFLRRLQFMIEFPMPGPRERLEIWKKAVPPEARVASDVDFTFLAEKLHLSGANIKNILLQAAFHAVKGAGEISMREIVLGVRHEMQKESKPLLRADLGEYYDYLEPGEGASGPISARGKGTRKAGLV